MNTEARVLATLNKIKEVQSKRKDLGAIADAVNEGKAQFYADASELNDYDLELTSLTDMIYNAVQNLKPELESLLQSKSKYNDLYYKLEEQAIELNDYGIEVGSEWPRVKDSYGYTVDTANELINSLSKF